MTMDAVVPHPKWEYDICRADLIDFLNSNW